MGSNKRILPALSRMHVQVEFARVSRFCALARAGWVEAKHNRGAGAWARGGRARAPLVLATAGDGQLSRSELRPMRVLKI